MTGDEPFYSPNYISRLTPRQPRVGELLFEFVRESDRAHFRCELFVHVEWGVEARFLRQGELLISRRFDSRKLAVQWAEAERPDLEKGAA